MDGGSRTVGDAPGLLGNVRKETTPQAPVRNVQT